MTHGDTFPEVGTLGVHDIGLLQPYLHSLPDVEQQHAGLLLFNLVQLNGFVNDFAGAVALVDLCEKWEHVVVSDRSQDQLVCNKNRYTLKLWREMAGRDASMTVYHYQKTLNAIRGEMKNVPTVKKDVAHKGLRDAQSALEKAFPGLEKVRNAIAHRAESLTSLKTFRTHAVSGTKFTLGSMQARVYTITGNGSKHRVTLDQETRKRFASVTATVYASFPKLADKLPPI